MKDSNQFSLYLLSSFRATPSPTYSSIEKVDRNVGHLMWVIFIGIRTKALHKIASFALFSRYKLIKQRLYEVSQPYVQRRLCFLNVTNTEILNTKHRVPYIFLKQGVNKKFQWVNYFCSNQIIRSFLLTFRSCFSPKTPHLSGTLQTS